MKENLNSQLERKEIACNPVSIDSFPPEGSPYQEKITRTIGQFFETQEAGELVAAEKKPTPPKDYLESSERLLLNLSEPQSSPEAIPHKSRSRLKGLINPLRVSSLLMVLIANILLSLELTNSGIFSTKPFSAKTATVGELPENPTSQVPNLANEGAVNLDLTTLTTLKVHADSSAGASPHRATQEATWAPNSTVIIPGAYFDLASALLPPSFRLNVDSDLVQPNLTETK